MEAYSFLIQNRDLVKIFYGLIVFLICFIIVIKADRLFRISTHQGIRNFRNAFTFFGLAFISRYILGIIFDSYNISIFLFEFFLIVGGFFLLHSLLWKKFRKIEKGYSSSLLSPVTLVFYLMAIIIVAIDFSWHFYLFMFTSQIIVFLIASIVSYKNYLNRPKAFFPKFYFIAMFLSLLAWILNAVAASFFNWNRGILINVYLLNIIVFLLFLFGVIKVTQE
jgi:hypothetical protein